MTDIIQQSLKNLRRARDEMQEELNRINIAIAALSGNPVSAVVGSIADESSVAVTTSAKSTHLNNTDMVRSVLAEHPKGLPFGEIRLRVIRSFNGHNIKKTSLSPLLTKLRKRGQAKLVDGVWYAMEHAPKSSAQSSFESLEATPTVLKEPVYYGGGRPT